MRRGGAGARDGSGPAGAPADVAPARSSCLILQAGAMSLPVGAFARPTRCAASATPPATTPQKAEPMPATVTPESVTRKVISAASR